IWSVIAATAAAVLVGAPFGGFSVVWKSFYAPAVTSVALAALSRFYRRRNDARLAAALEGTAQIMVFAAVGAPLSYLAASLNLPLRDTPFDAFDHALGFDWMTLLGFMNAHPALQPVATVIYRAFAPQLTVTILVLGFAGHLDRLVRFVLAFMLTALIIIGISALLPAEGAWTHYGLTAGTNMMLPDSHTSWPVFHGLRDGSYRLLIANGAEGIVTFPSLHAALGVIFAMALWPVPVLRWIALALNAAMLAATPIDGSHYLGDVLAGIAIAVGCWLTARKIVSLFSA
ncbi:MAG: phosphatase PAP2 family protein, partial [Pseudolabrys sp.]